LLGALKNSTEALRSDYNGHFSHIECDFACDSPLASTIRLHFVKHDASGEPRFQQLARMLVRYITLYCFTAERRKDLHETERNELFMRARDLFRRAEKSGQAGELLIYFLLETVLQAPQALKKMPLTTNPKEERKGSDGVHLRWDETDGVLEIIFAESKIWKSFGAAVADAFTSIETFHDSRTKEHEINCFTAEFSALSPELQERVISYVDGENAESSRYVHACLIGFDWDEYKCLDDERREAFVKEFEKRYSAWAAAHVRDSLCEKVKNFKHKHLRFEFFILPFRDVAEFRNWFLDELSGGSH
jgi:hypothetical protein